MRGPIHPARRRGGPLRPAVQPAPQPAPQPHPAQFPMGRHAVYGGIGPTTLLNEKDQFPYALVPKDYPIAVAANDSDSTSVTIDSANMFVFETLRASASGNFLCMIRDGASGLALMSKAVHSANLFGTAQRPGFISLYDWGIDPSDGLRTLEFELTDLSGSTNTIYFEVWGHRRRWKRGVRTGIEGLRGGE